MSAPRSSIVTLDGLSYAAPDGRSLFDNLTLTFGSERTGLVGRNGVGKSTLARLILGELAPSAGGVAVRGRLGVLRQALIPPPGATVADLMGVAEGLARLHRIEAGQGSEDDLAEADWALEARLAAALADVDLAGLDLQRPAAGLSGGQVTRASLAGLVASEPDLMILDEPTNNLDAAARDLVAEVLGRWKGGAIVISHDRALLRQMDRIVELSGLGAFRRAQGRGRGRRGPRPGRRREAGRPRRPRGAGRGRAQGAPGRRRQAVAGEERRAEDHARLQGRARRGQRRPRPAPGRAPE